MAPEAARRALATCCGSRAWVEGMLRRRPFGDDAALREAAAAVWRGLEPGDQREAFAAHPRIGDRSLSAGAAGDGPGPAAEAHGTPDAAGDRSRAWSRREQAGVASAPAEARRALEAGNEAYERRFGHVFLIRAAGRGPAEILAELRRRLGNDPEAELREAAREQLEITLLRLGRLGEEGEMEAPP